MKCPKCGSTATDDSVFCSTCGSPLQKRTRIPLAAGIIAIISSCLTLEAGNVLLIGASLEFNLNYQIHLHGGGPSLPFPAYFLSVGIFAIVTFAFGLFAGVSAVNRRFVKPAILGLGLLTISGVLITVPFDGSTSWEIGLPITFLSVLSIFFILMSKLEFC